MECCCTVASLYSSSLQFRLPFRVILVSSCAVGCHLLYSGKLLCALCMPSALCPPLSVPSASCRLPCVVLWGFTFFLSQTSVLFLWHGLNMCCCPLVLSVAISALCLLSPALSGPVGFCFLSFSAALHSLPSVWSCGVLPSLCPRHLCVFTCVASLICSLLPSASSAAICCPLLPSGDLLCAFFSLPSTFYPLPSITCLLPSAIS